MSLPDGGACVKLIDQSAAIRLGILELQQNTCANCGLDFSNEDSPRFRYLIDPSHGGEESEDNIEALCKRCFGESGSVPADQ